MGARLPAGWEERLRITDDEALTYRRDSERAAGTVSGAPRPPPLPPSLRREGQAYRRR
jgi:hypothetical protein